MKLRCLLVDDEPPALKVLATYFESMPTLEVVGACFNAFEAMEVLRHHPVDVLFLLGTEFVRTLRNPPKIIFTTAHKDYALEGFDLDAVDYLLKPFSFERFVKAINKITAGDSPTSEPAGPASPAVADNAFLYFRVDRKMMRVQLDEILYIESIKDYIRIVRSAQKPLLVKKSIGSVEEMLPEDRFLRIHRSYIINIRKLNAFTHNDVEIDGRELPIGKLYRHNIDKLSTI
jgi:DNA-binding LytR/AlgR family response regulator